MAKSDKMYKKSPKIEKDEKGKPTIKKPSEADAEDMGLGKGGGEKGEGEMPIDVHEQERLDMAKRHVTEMKDMHKRHSEEFEKMHSRHAMARGSDKLEGTPAEKIKETE